MEFLVSSGLTWKNKMDIRKYSSNVAVTNSCSFRGKKPKTTKHTRDEDELERLFHQLSIQ